MNISMLVCACVCSAESLCQHLASCPLILPCNVATFICVCVPCDPKSHSSKTRHMLVSTFLSFHPSHTHTHTHTHKHTHTLTEDWHKPFDTCTRIHTFFHTLAHTLHTQKHTYAYPPPPHTYTPHLAGLQGRAVCVWLVVFAGCIPLSH